jgi:Gti1/Pac2 family transcription factor
MPTVFSFVAAYFNQRTIDSLGKIDDVPNVGGHTVPENLFRSARAMKGKKEDIRRSMGQIIGPVSEQAFSPSTGSGALYTIFSSTAQPESLAANSEPSPPPPPSRHEPSYEFTRTPSYGAPTRHRSVHPSPPDYSQSASPKSVSSGYSPRPLSYSSKSGMPTNQPRSVMAPSPALVPLEYLQSIPPPHRDPADVLYLQRLSVSQSRDSSPVHSMSGAAQPRTPPFSHSGDAANIVPGVRGPYRSIRTYNSNSGKGNKLSRCNTNNPDFETRS